MPDYSKGNWPKVAIGGLVLVNIVLLALLVLREPSRTVAAEPLPAERATPTLTRSTAPQSPAPTPVQTSASGSTPGAATPSGTAGSSETGAPPAASGSTRMLAVNSKDLAWRGVLGTCPTSSEVEVSQDGGRSWARASVDLRSVTRLRSYGGSSVFAVGGGEDCAARYVATSGPAESWRPDGALLGQTWYRLPDAPYRVHAPGGRMSRPCGDALADLAGLGEDNAAALCADGVVRTTTNSGRSWREVEGGIDGLALGADDRTYVVALRTAGCDGVAVSVLDTGTEAVDRDEARCAPVGGGPDTDVAVGIREDTVWVWAGSDVTVSTDRGRSWDRA